VTVNTGPVPLPALAVTVTGPLVAPAGTSAEIRVVLSTRNLALWPAKATAVTWLNRLPDRVTGQPGAPCAGTTEETLGPPDAAARAMLAGRWWWLAVAWAGAVRPSAARMVAVTAPAPNVSRPKSETEGMPLPG
jgi:hypothetical protein